MGSLVGFVQGNRDTGGLSATTVWNARGIDCLGSTQLASIMIVRLFVLPRIKYALGQLPEIVHLHITLTGPP